MIFGTVLLALLSYGGPVVLQAMAGPLAATPTPVPTATAADAVLPESSSLPAAPAANPSAAATTSSVLRPSPRRRANFMAAPQKGPGDLLYGPLRYFVNTRWNCKTFAGSDERHVYVRQAGYGFSLHNELRTLAGQTYRLTESYTFDWQHRRWKVQLAGGAYVADSVLATYNDLILEGHDVERGAPVLVRMHYHMYDDVIFRRDFEVFRGGNWYPSSGETCERVDFAVNR